MRDPDQPTEAARAAALRLPVDHATADVLRAFEIAGVESILLRGPNITRWLYEEDGGRAYADCDLLVSPRDASAARRVLRELGYVPSVEEEEMPSWWREHATAWIQPGRVAVVDLHRTLVGVEGGADALWQALAEGTEELEVGGGRANGLTLPGRALLVALHAAQHGPEWGTALLDLERALARADEATWRAAAELAARVGATTAFASGLRLVKMGRGLATRLGLPAERSVEEELRATAAPPEALTIERIARAGRRARLGIIHHKLAPPATFMRHSSSLARRGRLGLALAYGLRLAWIPIRTPSALIAWRRARRAVDRDSADRFARPRGEEN